MTHKKLSKYHDFSIEDIFVSVLAIDMLSETIRVCRHVLCPSDEPRLQRDRL